MVSTGKMLAFINALGGNSGPSEVVILPETEYPGGGMDTQIPITTPLSAMPTPGATAIVTWNGTEYACQIARQTESGNDGYLMGNFEAMGAPYGGSNPDAPFVVALVPAGMGGMYGVIMPVEEVASITLSIVQVGAASGGESAGGGVFTVHATASYENNAFTFNGFDKSFSEMKAAYNADKHIRVVIDTGDGLNHIGQVMMALYGDRAAALGDFALCVEVVSNPKIFDYFYFFDAGNGAIAVFEAA